MSKTRILTLFAAVPIEIRNSVMFDRSEARAALKTDAARKLFDELMTEAWGRVRWLPRGPLVATAMISCIAMATDAVALAMENATP